MNSALAGILIRCKPIRRGHCRRYRCDARYGRHSPGRRTAQFEKRDSIRGFDMEFTAISIGALDFLRRNFEAELAVKHQLAGFEQCPSL
jgi:hypothetical protein